jgi:aldehyde:ferredoxin oxidoreductase
VPISDPEAYSAALKEHYKGFNSPYGIQHREYGSSKTIYGVQEFGLLPTRNWQTGIFDAVEALYPENWIAKYRVHKHGCPYCPIPCGHITLVRDGPYAGEMSEGPEYETLFAFGSMLGISNMDAVIAANGLSDRLGIDQIETGAAIAFAMECYQRGILTKNETDGLELTWGNHEALITLMKKIANREGLGALLSKGVRVMAEEIGRGTERFAMQVKGLALGGYDPRAVKGQGISMAQAPRGGCHHNAARSVLWETKHPYNPLDNEGKPELIRKLILLRMYVDLAPMCAFYQPITNLDTVSKLLTSVTGIKFDEEKILMTDERVYNLERAFNVRLGVTRHHDTLPERLLKDPMPEGPAKGHVWEGRILMDGFYEVSGWDKKTGIPTRKKLIDLELKDVAEDLEKKGINLSDE